MALFGRSRDISLFRHINRELLGDIVTQQIAYYKIKLEQTYTNLYGESPEGRMFAEPVLLNCRIERSPQTQPQKDFGDDFEWSIDFMFLRDDLVDANLVPEIGDVIMYYDSYFEVYDINTNQYFIGKNPDYPYNTNPLNPGLDQFGYNVSIICKTHVLPSDYPGITKERL